MIPVIIGIGILGFSKMFYDPLFIPEILDILKEIDPETKGNEELASGLFMASISVTTFIGSILGGYLSDDFGFDRGMAIYAMIMLAYFVVFAFGRKYKVKKVEVSMDLIMSEDQVSFDQVLLENEQNNSRV